MANEAITRRLKIFVNGQEVDATITNLRKNLAKFRTQSNRAVEGTPEWKKYNAEVAKTEIELKQAIAAQKDYRDSAKLTEKGLKESTKTLADFTGNLSQMFQGAKRGDFLQMQEGFEGVKKGIYGATKAGLAFIATPLGATIAALAGIAFVAKQWFNYNESIKESIILTEQITKLTGQQADAIRLRNKALSETFGTDQEETLIVARNLVENFNISYVEALDTIEAGLVKGQAKNKEYLDSLREYPVFFAAAGFSVNEFNDIVAAGFDLGIYSDKLPDAIKEFDISIREQTKATREALINAFGQTFTDELLERVNSGKTSTKDALQEIAAESEKLGLSIEQNQRLTADVFRGAGEDVGGAAKVFEAIRFAAEGANRALTPLEQSTKDLADANRELAEAQDEALKSDNYISLARDIEIFWTDIKTQFFNGISFITDFFARSIDIFVSNFAATVVTAQKLPQILTKGLKDIATNALNVIKTFGGLGEVFQNLATFKFDAAAESAKKFKNNFTEAFSEVKNSATGTVKEIIATREAALSLAQEQLDNKRAGNVASVNAANTSAGVNANNGNSFEGSDEAAKAKEKAVADAIRKKQAVQDAIDKFDEEQAIRDQLKQVEKDQRAEEEDVIRKELEFEKLITEAAGDTELLAQLETAKLNEIQAIRDSYAETRLAKEAEEKQKLAELDKKVKEERIKAEENFQQAKSNALNAGLNTLQGIFGKETALGKALFLFQKGKAISDIIQSTALANAKIGSSLAAANAIAVAASPLTGGQPWVTVNTANSAKNTAANNINAATQIATIGATALKGITSKEEGGFTPSGPSTGGLDGRGGQLVVNHPNEYYIPQPLIRQDPEVPRIIEYLEAKRTGAATQTAQENPSENNNQSNQVMAMLAQAVNNLVEKGVKASTYYGLEDELERQKIQDKLDKTILESKN